MGRGLSTLQKQILVLADQCERQGKGILHYCVIYQRVYGWEVAWWAPYEGRDALGWWSKDNGQPVYHWRCGHLFDPELVGRKAYSVATSAVTRAVSRLERRGLCRVFCGAYAKWTAVQLTEAGRLALDRLSADTEAIGRSFQPIQVAAPPEGQPPFLSADIPTDAPICHPLAAPR